MPGQTKSLDPAEQSSTTMYSKGMEKILQGGGLFLLASFFGNGLNYLFGIFIARNLGSEQFGLYSIGLTVINILLFIVPVGMDTAIIKFSSEQLSYGEELKATNTIFNALILVGFLSFVFSFILAVAAVPLSVVLLKKSGLVAVLLFFAFIFPFSSIENLLINAIQAFQALRVIIFIKYIWEPLGKFILTGLFFGLGYGLNGLLLSLLVTFIVSFLIALTAVRRLTGLTIGNIPRWDFQTILQLLRFSSPLMITNIFGVIATRMDILILGYWVSSEKVGYYTAAFQTSAILSLVLSAFTQLFSPLVAGALTKNSRQSLIELYQGVSRWSLTISLPVFLLIIIFGQDVLSLFGKDFSEGNPSLILLSIGQLTAALLGSSSTILLMSGHSRHIMWNTIVLDSLLIASIFLLVPYMGLLGPALAVSVKVVLSGIIGVIQVWIIHRILPFRRELVKPLIAGLFAVAFSLFMKGKLSNLLYVTTVGPCVVFIYLIGLYLLKIETTDYMILNATANKIKYSVRKMRVRFI